MSDILCSAVLWLGVDWDRCKGATVAKKIDTPVGVGCGGASTVAVPKDAVEQEGKVSDAQGETPFLDGYESVDIKDVADADGGSFCIEGMEKTSYSGPSGTEGIGICQPNKWLCKDGKYKLIQIEVLLHPELCNNGLDDDCDELTDEGCEPLKDVVEDPDVFQPSEDVFSADEFNPLPDQISIPDVDGKDIYEVFFPDTLDIQELDTYELPPESCEIGNSGVLAEAEGIQFCNLPTVLTTNIPILPVCIKPTQEYKETQLNGAFPPHIMLGGVEVPLDEECNSKDTGFWAEVQLKPGENIITGEITYKDKGPKSMEISVTYDPNCSTSGQNLIYGISNNQIVVIDADYGWMMGKIYSSLPGFGPKNLVIFPDYSKVVSPREAGIDVIDTSLNKVVENVIDETGGYASLSEDGMKLFVNRHTLDSNDEKYHVNIFNTQNWQKTASFPAEFSNEDPIITKSGKLYTAEECCDGGYVYYPPNYTTSKQIKLYGPLAASNPQKDLIVAALDGIGTDKATFIDTKIDAVSYILTESQYVPFDLSDAIFSSDGEVCYLTGINKLIAHSVKFKATLWQIDLPMTNWWEGYKGYRLAINPYGPEIFAATSSEENCSKDLFVLDADDKGKVLMVFPNIPFEKDLIYKPAY